METYPFPRPGRELPAALEPAGPARPVALRTGGTAWLLCARNDARAALASAHASADPRRAGYPFLAPGGQVLRSRRSLLRMDDPEHARLRRALAPAFTPAAAAAARPAITRRLEVMLASFAPVGEGDLVSGLAAPAAAGALCGLLGFPVADRVLFERLTHTLGSHTTPGPVKADAEAALADYVRAAMRDATGTGLVARLARRGDVDRADLAGSVQTLITAGFETVAAQTAWALLELCEDPALAARLCRDRSRIGAFVEAGLAANTVIHHGITRVATAAIALPSATIGAGEGFIVALPAVNRDPAAAAAGKHLAFGYGAHQCLGRHLARVQVAAAVETVLASLPGLRLARPSAALTYTTAEGVVGPAALPAAWDRP